MAETLMITSSGEYIYFDSVISTSHEAEISVTEHPVQSGASIADHSYIEPETVSLEVHASDVMSDEAEHSINAFQKYKLIMYTREPLTLVTRYQTYRDMLLVSISSKDDYSTMYGLKASLSFKHVEIVTASTVSIQDKTSSSRSNYESSSEPATTTTPADEVDSVQVDNNESLLHRLLGHQSVIQALGHLL